MKILRYIIIAFTSIILIALFLSFLAPTDFDVSRSIEINEPMDEVWEDVNSLQDLHKWSPWASKDPNIKYEFSGEEGRVGSIYKWNGDPETVGIGEQEITSLDPPYRMDSELRFKEPMESVADAYVELEKINENTTRATYGFTSEMARPMNILLLFMDMDKQIGPDFESAMKNLKEYAEKGE